MQWLREGPKFKQASVFFFAGALGGVGAGAAEEGLRLQGPGDPIRQKSVACRLQEVFSTSPNAQRRKARHVNGKQFQAQTGEQGNGRTVSIDWKVHHRAKLLQERVSTWSWLENRML